MPTYQDEFAPVSKIKLHARLFGEERANVGFDRIRRTEGAASNDWRSGS
jgi:hypothetical protein